MPQAVIVIKRELSFPKAVWRTPSTQRWLKPLSIEPVVSAALSAWDANPLERAIIECEVTLDGSLLRPPAVRAALDRNHTGVLLLDFSGTGLKVHLSQEACQRALPSPKRVSRHLATLQPGVSLCVVLNGKADWPSGRYYYLQDYQVIFHGGAAGAGFQEPRTIDLQADLV